MNQRRSRQDGRVAVGLALAGLAWCAALLVAAFVVPVYSGEQSSSTGVVTHTSGTLVGTNGARAIVLMMVPLMLALAAFAGLHRKCATGSALSAAGAWTAIAALALLAVLGAASIGLFVLPATLLLAFSAALTPSGPSG